MARRFTQQEVAKLIEAAVAPLRAEIARLEAEVAGLQAKVDQQETENPLSDVRKVGCSGEGQ